MKKERKQQKQSKPAAKKIPSVRKTTKKKRKHPLVTYIAPLFIFIFSVMFGLSLQNNLPTSRQRQHLPHKVFAPHLTTRLIASPSPSMSLFRPLTVSPSPTVVPTSTPTPTSSLSDDGSNVHGSSVTGSGFCLYVPVFMYHHIEPMAQAQEEGHGSLTVDNGWFDQQMGYMVSHGYTFVSLATLVHAIINHQALPPKTAVLTADDGYIDIFQYAYPIIQKYHIIMNLFIPAGLIDNSDYMTWDQLKQMQNSGLIFIYNHTWSHYPLGQGDATKISFEMTTSQNEFKQYLGITPTIMAYPYGSFSPLSIQILQSEGFVAAFSTLPGIDECSSNLMTEPRYRIGNAPMSAYGF